jgi:hypothetical protein
MTMNDLIPYLELHKTMKEDGRETILNNELEEKEKEFVGKEISLSGTVSEIDLEGNELIVAYLYSSPEEQSLIENKMISHYFFVFGYAADLKNQVDTLKIEIDDLVLISGVIISLHRNSIMRILLSSVSVTKKNQGPAKLKKKKGCFIATAVYEDPDSPEIMKFYGIRDHILSRTFFGRILIAGYYFISPPLARWIGGKPAVKRLVRRYVLDPILCFFYN